MQKNEVISDSGEVPKAPETHTSPTEAAEVQDKPPEQESPPPSAGDQPSLGANEEGPPAPPAGEVEEPQPSLADEDEKEKATEVLKEDDPAVSGNVHISSAIYLLVIIIDTHHHHHPPHHHQHKRCPQVRVIAQPANRVKITADTPKVLKLPGKVS